MPTFAEAITCWVDKPDKDRLLNKAIKIPANKKRLPMNSRGGITDKASLENIQLTAASRVTIINKKSALTEWLFKRSACQKTYDIRKAVSYAYLTDFISKRVSLLLLGTRLFIPVN